MSGCYDTAPAMPLPRAALYPPPGCLNLPRTIRRWQPDGFEPEPEPDVALRPSPRHLAEKLFKKLLRCRKAVAPFSGIIPCRHIIRDAPVAVVEEQPAPDPNEDACSETSKSSLSSSPSVDSLLIPSHKSVMAGSAQMMASMLLLVLDNEGDDSEASEEESEDDETCSGPRLSTWHQPAEPDEFVNAQQEWRWLRHEAKSPTSVSQTVKNTEAADYVRYKYMATVPGSTTVHRNTVTLSDCLWVRGELPHLLVSVLEVFQFNAAPALERLLGPLTASGH